MGVWRSYRKEFAHKYPDISLLRRVQKNIFARFNLRHVRHATFEELSLAGYDVCTFDDGAVPLNLEEVARGNLPKNWKVPQAVTAPKVARLRDTVLFHDGSALLPDGRYCFFDTGFVDQTWRKLKIFRFRMLRIVDPTTHDALIRRRHLPIISIPGRCFSLRHSNGPKNFGYFVHDVLTRIYYEDLGVIVPGRDKVISPTLPTPMQKALFKMVFDDYEIVQIPPNAPVKAEELLLPSNLCNAWSFNPAAFAALATRMRKFMEPYAGRKRCKVCVSRRDGTRTIRGDKETLGRDFVNFEDYEIRMRKLGYELVEVSTLEPEDQFMLWANTTDIVGIHGAGMMNMIMMPLGGHYTEIAGTLQRNLHSPCPNTTIRSAMASGHHICGISSGHDLQGRPVIDIERLEAELSCMAQ